jgi:hypothetical protein
MELNLTESAKELLQAFFLLILPWIVIIIGVIVPIESVWYYLLSITWFGSGVIFFATLR